MVMLQTIIEVQEFEASKDKFSFMLSIESYENWDIQAMHQNKFYDIFDFQWPH